jgi:peptidoglycan/LPS O-acetylase OafA/YrhL
MSETIGVRPVPRSLYGLQASRAVAALLVVFFHTSQSIFALPKYWDNKPFGNIFDFGDSGVMFFFVLSGFIILHAHYSDIGRPSRLIDYILKRVRRIYPLYWLLLILVAPVYYFMPQLGLGFESQFYVVLSSIFLVHINTPYPVITVSWTLFHEILFYAVFALMLWQARIGFVVMATWLALSLVGLLMPGRSWVVDFYLSALHMLFAFGMAAAWWVRRSRVPMPALLLATGIALFLLAGVERNEWDILSEGWRAIVYGVGATMAVLGLVELERGGRLRTPGWLRLLGDASYSIYLVHFFALSLLAKIVWRLGVAHVLPQTASFLALVLMATACGVVLHFAVEKPVLRFLGARKTSRLQQGSSPTPAGESQVPALWAAGYLLTNGHPPSARGRNASSLGMV